MNKKILIGSFVLTILIIGGFITYWYYTSQTIQKIVLDNLAQQLEFCEILKDKGKEFWLICNNRPFYATYENGNVSYELNGWGQMRDFGCSVGACSTGQDAANNGGDTWWTDALSRTNKGSGLEDWPAAVRVEDIGCVPCSAQDSGSHCCSDDMFCAGGASSCGSLDCGASVACNDITSNTNIPYCDRGGYSYFADRCDVSCQAVDRDNTCRASGSIAPGNGCTADSLCDGKTADTFCSSDCKYPSCSLEANPSAGIDQFNSTLTATFYNMPSGSWNADMKCGDGVIKSSIQPIDSATKQASMTCTYTPVVTITTYEAFANWSTVTCKTTVINYDGAIDFDAWLGINNTAFTVGQAFPISVYVKNKGTIIDSYKVVPISTANLQARIFDDVIENVTPSRIDKTEVEITAIAITANERMDIMVNSTLVPTFGNVLTLTISSGIPSLADIDIFSIAQIMILSMIVLLLSKRLVRIS